jgi:predicted nucleic acid-binding protein
MARVYLDTSFVSACVTTREDAHSIVRKETSLEWMQSQRPLHEVLISSEVADELNQPTFAQRGAALLLIADIPRLAITEEVRGVAHVLVNERVMPGPADTGDAIHVAVATVHQVNHILSWNVRHLANPNKIAHLQAVCRRLGLIPPSILTPDLLWETS